MNTGKGRILVVDDEMINRVLLSTNLQESGYIVETAEDGQQALEMLRAQPFDVVLLDLIMPRVDGYQVLAQMKDDDALRRIPVIVISSSDEMESIVRCIEMGATDYLTKPFNPVLLHARLNASLASLHEERMAILRQQLAQVTAAQEEERQRIVRELHDGVGPALASLNIRLRTARKLLERDHHPVAEEVEELAELAQASIQDIRRLIHDLRPAALDEVGLRPALREYVSRYREEQSLEVALALPVLSPVEGPEGDERLPAPLETALFRIVQEALANVAKHAQAHRVDVALMWDEAHVILRLTDDGRGFDPQAPRPGTHLGLWSMRERVEQLGGRFEVESTLGTGTAVKAIIPLGTQE
ncbi:MAG: response regulator [Dehalococcoidia bacterium]|nr:MAG: response regulator [Dehalococcoidia bacterium]